MRELHSSFMDHTRHQALADRRSAAPTTSLSKVLHPNSLRQNEHQLRKALLIERGNPGFFASLKNDTGKEPESKMASSPFCSQYWAHGSPLPKEREKRETHRG